MSETPLTTTDTPGERSSFHSDDDAGAAATAAKPSVGDTTNTPHDGPLPPPIFVGGTGRSGTTIVGRLLGRHPDHEVIPVEARFHASQDGLPGVLGGSVTPAEFTRRVVEQWYSHPGRPKLSTFIERDALDAALARFLARAQEDLIVAGRELMEEMFGAYARRMGKRGWVEMTPVNSIWGAPALAKLFPELRMVCVMRDGRDVASSLVGIGWISDIREALAWWETRMWQSHHMCQKLAPGAMHIVRFEQLLIEDRAGALRDLREFLGWADEYAMQRFFARRMTPEDAHVGRWKTHCSPEERAFLAAEYPAALARLQAAGVPVP
jgi:hypothetical protein